MSKAKARKGRRKRTPGAQRRSPRSNRGANFSASADARPGNDPDTKAAGSGNVCTRHYRSGVPKSYSIKTIAEAKQVSTRTVRRWIATGKLIAHRIGGVLRINEDDFRAFWASYRDA
jgi:excisionase family DNA binding protein